MFLCVTTLGRLQGGARMGRKQLTQHQMTADEFYLWLESQNERYELVDGQPMLMAGATIAHDTFVMNAARVIGNQLFGKPCRPRSADIAIRVSDHQVRYPDLSVDCGDPASSAREAGKPALVIEVESRSTGMVDAIDKLEEYKSIPSMQYIILVSTRKPRVRFYCRNESSAWDGQVIIGMESQLEMPLIGVTLSLGDLYYDLRFEAEPS